MSISLIFLCNEGDQNYDEIIVHEINPNSTTCEQLIRKFCEKSCIPFVTAKDNLAFIFNGKTLNSQIFIYKYLSEIGITKTRRRILIKPIAHLVGQ